MLCSPVLFQCWVEQVTISHLTYSLQQQLEDAVPVYNKAMVREARNA